MNEFSPRPTFMGHDESFTPIALVRSCAGAPVACVPAHHEVHTYIDTLQVWLASPLSPDQLDFLRAHSGGVSIFTGTLRNRPDLRRRCLIQHPSAEALAFLARKASYDHLVNRVDVALDLVVGTAAAARRLHDFFYRHMVQRWHGRRRMAVYRDTTYLAQDRTTARNLVQYCDKLSKVTGGPCCHLELRLKSASACRRAGIEYLDDLLRLNHRKVWAKELCLRAVDQHKLERQIDKAAGQTLMQRPGSGEWLQAHSTEPLTRREAVKRGVKADLAVALRVEGGPKVDPDELHLAPAQAWREVQSDYAKRCLIAVPCEQFLPDSTVDFTLIK
jgi:hypothetical protein